MESCFAAAAGVLFTVLLSEINCQTTGMSWVWGKSTAGGGGVVGGLVDNKGGWGNRGWEDGQGLRNVLEDGNALEKEEVGERKVRGKEDERSSHQSVCVALSAVNAGCMGGSKMHGINYSRYGRKILRRDAWGRMGRLQEGNMLFLTGTLQAKGENKGFWK